MNDKREMMRLKRDFVQAFKERMSRRQIPAEVKSRIEEDVERALVELDHNDRLETDELIESVREWGRDRHLNDPVMQFAKFNEEGGEIAHELTRGRYDTDEIKDAIGDTLVTLIIFADILGFKAEECLEIAYNEIKTRRGITKNGTFIKEQ